MISTLNHLKPIFSALFFSIYIFEAPSLLAQDKNEELELNMELRPRSEFRNGLFTPILKGHKPAAFVAQRSRIALICSQNQKLKIGVSTQVVTTWGNDRQVQTTANDISLYEAWAQFYFNLEWSLKVRRQVLSYDDQRILAALDWNHSGRKHDAAVLAFEKNKFKANAVLAFNQNAEKVTNTFYDNSLSQPYKAMQFLWVTYGFRGAVSVSALALNVNLQSDMDSSVSSIQTLGGNIYYNKDDLKINGTCYYQTGRNPVKNSSSMKTSSWMAAVKADYNLNQKIGFGIGSDYLSGKDMNSTSSKITYFNPLYGTHHKFYGFMDYFYVSSAHGNVGLWDSYLNLNWNVTGKRNWQMALHHFESAARVVNYTGGKANSALGNEADITFDYKVMDDVNPAGGYSQMFTGPSMKYGKNISQDQGMASMQNWIWLSININPDILIYKSK